MDYAVNVDGLARSRPPDGSWRAFRRRPPVVRLSGANIGHWGNNMVEIEGYAAPSEHGPPSYAQVTKVTGAQTILFIAGQVAYDDTGGPAHGRDFAAQARAVFRSLQAQAQVEAGGGTLANIVKITTFLTDIRYREELVPIREEFFGKKTPADHPGRRLGARPAGMADRGRGYSRCCSTKGG